MSYNGRTRQADPEIDYSVKSLFSLKGKTAIVTGGGSGIGLAVSKAYADAGANVGIIYNSSPSAIERAKEIAAEYGVKVQAYKCDVSDFDAIKATFEQVAKDFGSYDIVVANSGVQQTTACLDMTPQQWNDVIQVNFNGVFYCAQIAANYFKDAQRPGNIIVTASMSGHIVNFPQKQGCYNAAKAGCIHMVKSLAVEWAPLNIRVNSVSPGYINTLASADYNHVKGQWYERTPLGRDAACDELRGVYLFLASNASTFVTGSDIVIDGGYTTM